MKYVLGICGAVDNGAWMCLMENENIMDYGFCTHEFLKGLISQFTIEPVRVLVDKDAETHAVYDFILDSFAHPENELGVDLDQLVKKNTLPTNEQEHAYSLCLMGLDKENLNKLTSGKSVLLN